MYYYKLIQDGKTVSVEAKSRASISPNFVKATKAEYDAYIASLPVIEPEPVRNLATEMDELKARLGELEKK